MEGVAFPRLRGIARVLVLKALEDSPLHGYALMQRIREATGVRPSPGYLYPLLRKLEREGLIKSSEAELRGRRVRVYELTDKGRLYLAQNKQLVERAEELVRKLSAAREIGLQRLIGVLREIFERADALDDQTKQKIRCAVDEFSKSVRGLIG
ncbi:MAG: PadR family transcriptional regulator [Desulfurococcaceae archaeon]